MRLSLVVPLFNEEQAVQLFYRTVRQQPALAAYTVEILLINDGSTDRTAEYAKALALSDRDVVLINFSRNFGKEAALFAGLEYASGEAVIPILQESVPGQETTSVILRGPMPSSPSSPSSFQTS